MEDIRKLLIIHKKKLLRFILFLEKEQELEILHEKAVLLNDRSYDFSLSDYIVQILNLWGEEIGIKLVRNMVPLIPQVRNEGLSEVNIISDGQIGDLSEITQNIFLIDKEINKEALSAISGIFKFQNLLFVNIDLDGASIIRFTKDSRGNIGVVVESKKYNVENIINGDKFKELVNRFKTHIDTKRIINYSHNLLERQSFNEKSYEYQLLYLILNSFRLEGFRKSSKLFDGFGRGEMKGNLLVVGGDMLNSTKNVPLVLLSSLLSLSLEGNYTICIDKYGLFDCSQKITEKYNDLYKYPDLLMKLWGSGITIESKQNEKLVYDEQVSTVRVDDGNSTQDYISTLGSFLKLKLSNSSNVSIRLKKKFKVKEKNPEQKFEDLSGNLLVDSRVYKLYGTDNFNQDQSVIMKWLKEIGSLDSNYDNSN